MAQILDPEKIQEIKSLIKKGLVYEDDFIEMYLKMIRDEGFMEYFPEAGREAAKADGYFVPFQLCTGLAIAMAKHDLSFVEAFEYLTKRNKIFLDNREFSYDASEDEVPKKKLDKIPN